MTASAPLPAVSPWRAGQVRLARDLLGRAVAVLRRQPPADREGHHQVLVALEPFLGDPRPAGYLASCRELAVLDGRGEQRRVLQSRARLVERSLAALRLLPGVPAAAVERLVADPAGASAETRSRLQVLEALLSAHQELASRAQAASQRLRASLAPRATPPRTASTPRPRRSAARTPAPRRAGV